MPVAKQRAAAADASPLVLDSSCWLEFLLDSPRADAFAAPILVPETLIVPVITIYEVFKKIARELSQEIAGQAVSLMRRGQVVDLDIQLCIDAATNGLPFADSLIYATAQSRNAILWTQDAHFDGLPGVKYFPKS